MDRSRLAKGALAASVLASLVPACTRGPLSLPSPDRFAGQVVIRRDTLGIPHILAQSEEAAAYGFGYAQAEDHAVAIAMGVLTGRGQGARYFGERYIENDFAQAQFDNLAESRRGLTTVSPLYRRMLAAYAAGVNRYFAQHRDSLPPWMPELVPEDVLANSRAGAASSLAGLTRQLRAKYEGGSPAPRGEEEEWLDAPGSNAFALSGSRTATGKPILLGNPHLSWSSLYWEAHVRVPGRIDFYGSTLAGIPVLRAGFNDRLGFVTTNNAPDLDDVFALRTDSPSGDRYVFDGRWMPLVRREASIEVLAPDGSTRTETRTFWYSHLGPVVYRGAGCVFVVRSTRLSAFQYFEGFYLLSKARTLEQWMSAMRRNYVPTSNFTYADADGNILYLWNGRVPVRRKGVDYTLDVSVTSPADLWSRLHSVDDFPRLLNPPGGYVQNANNPPRFVSLRDPIDMSPYPSSFERGPLALRPQLAIDMLESRQTFSVDDVIALKYDTRMLLAERVKRAVIDAVRASPDAPEEARAGADALAAWDDRVSAGSRGAVLFQRFWDLYSAAVRPPFAAPWSEEQAASTPSGIANPAAVTEHLAAAVRSIRETYGSESLAWGDVNRFRAGALDLPGEGATGAYGCFRVVRFDQVPGTRIRAAGHVAPGRPPIGFGDAWVLLVDFSPPVTGWSVLAYGQTTDLSSPHSSDQLRTFAEHRLRRAWFTEAEIAANLEREYRP